MNGGGGWEEGRVSGLMRSISSSISSPCDPGRHHFKLVTSSVCLPLHRMATRTWRRKWRRRLIRFSSKSLQVGCLGDLLVGCLGDWVAGWLLG